MSELIFDVTIDEDGRYVAIARGNGIATDGADWDDLKANVRELIEAYYFDTPKPASFHLIHNEILAVA
jgi:predicted RNase H-like HicB family nuclease